MSLHESMAAFLRSMPRFRGKARLGVALGRMLPEPRHQAGPSTVRMKDGSLMSLDYTKSAERFAYWTGEYDSEIMRRLAACLRDGSIVFDVGANVGCWSIALGRKLRPLHGTLYAFEPVPGNFVCLQQVIALNNLEQVVRPFHFALGDEEGEIDLHLEESNADPLRTGNAVMVKRGSGGMPAANVKATIRRLDNFAEKEGLDECSLIKVDIEGAEVMFLRGGASFLRKSRPVIYGEFNAHWIKALGYSFRDVVDLVAPWGYRFYQRSGRSHFIELTRTDGAEDKIGRASCRERV